MKSDDFLKTMNDIDDDMIKEDDKTPAKARQPLKIAALIAGIAAAVAVIVCCLVILGRVARDHNITDPTQNAEDEQTAEAEGEYASEPETDENGN